MGTSLFIYTEERIYYANAAASTLTGYPEEELLQKSPLDLVESKDRERVRQVIRDRIAGREAPERYELTMVRKDGSLLWVEFFAGSPRREDEEVFLFGTATDITRRRHLEDSLRHRLAIEQRLSIVAGRLLRADQSNLPEELSSSLKLLAESFNSPSACLCLFERGSHDSITLDWKQGEVHTKRAEKECSPRNWLENLGLSQRVQVFKNLNLLPEGLDDLRKSLEGGGIRSTAFMVIGPRSRPIGILRLDGRTEGTFSSKTIYRLLVVTGDVFSHGVDRVQTLGELLESRERLELAQEASNSVVWEWWLESDEMILSPFAKFLYDFRDRLPTTGKELFEYIPILDQVKIQDSLRNAISNGEHYSVEHRVCTPDGVIRWMSVRGQPIFNEEGRVDRVIGVSSDISHMKEAEEELFAEKERAQVTLASIADGVIRVNARGELDYLNPTAELMTGWSFGEALGQPVEKVYKVLDERTRFPRRSSIEECLAKNWTISFNARMLVREADEMEFLIQEMASPIKGRGGILVGAVVVFRDVTQLRGLQRERNYLASHDPLTGLINRREFETRLGRLLEDARNEKTDHVLCYIDLDDFKVVNDTAGHLVGDQLLKQIASTLTTFLHGGDTLGRLGGDEFALLLKDCTVEEALKRCDSLCRAVRNHRFRWEDRIFKVGASVGIVALSHNLPGLEDALKAADSACYVAKNEGRNRVHIYKPDDKAIAELHGEMQWIHTINSAINENRLRLYQQVISPVGEDNKEEKFCEIFIRIRDVAGEMIKAAEFFPAAERYRLASVLDRWVVSRIVQKLSTQRLEQTVFAVNLSGQSLGEKSFLDFLVEKLTKANFDPHYLCFEITETAAVTNLTRALEVMKRLRKIGYRFILDDFGTGLSSFVYLKTLPVDFLKIDGEFVRQVAHRGVEEEMISAIHRLGHAMNLKTIAESVETAEVLQKLTELGIDYAQGFFIGAPEPLDI